MPRHVAAGTPGRRGRAVARSGYGGAERVRTPARTPAVGRGGAESGTIAAQQTPRQVGSCTTAVYQGPGVTYGCTVMPPLFCVGYVFVAPPRPVPRFPSLCCLGFFFVKLRLKALRYAWYVLFIATSACWLFWGHPYLSSGGGGNYSLSP